MNPRQYSTLRWIESLSFHYEVGRGRAVAAGAVGSGRRIGRMSVALLVPG